MLPLENMPQVGAAVRTFDFNSHAVRVWQPSDAPGDLFVKTGPAAAGVKLAIGTIEGRSASLALVRSGGRQVLVLSRIGRLGTLPNDDPFLFPAEFPPVG
jgi:hypothetical protein